MKLNEEQRKIFIDKLNEIWQIKHCNICHDSNWSLSDQIFDMREFNDGNLIVGGSVYPVIPVTCLNCGNTHLLNPLVLGILKNNSNQGDEE